MLRRGIAVSPGVAIGTAYCVDEVLARLEPGELNRAQAARELARLDRAWTAAIDELRALQHKVAAQVGDKEAAIFHAHEMILHDPTLVTSVKESITSKHLPARAALHELLNEYTSRFARFKDEYWRERLADVRDVITRVSTHLAAIGNSDAAAAKGPVILVAQEVLPSQAAALGRLQVAGIVTETGAATSHAAILARSRGIP
ncbi:MAG: phosphoenolpyruvate--protein phosphotransferase, partial [Planctomycetes bacterium]|nr:phosphoenolpyruvate--protein phosphotransferase [Planctomycetota bacterium]